MHDQAERSRIVAEVAERAAAEIRERAEAEARRLSEERRRMSDAFLGEQRRALAELDRATVHHFGVVKAHTERLLGALRETIERAREPLPFDVPAPDPAQMEPAPAPAATPGPEPPPSAADTIVVPQHPPQQAEQPAPAPPAPEPPAAPPRPQPIAERDRGQVVAAPAAGKQRSPSEASGRGRFLHHSTEATALAAQMATAGSSRDEIIRALRERFSISDPEPLADEAVAHYGS